MRLMFSELEDAKRILKNGFSDGYKWSEALAVAKYYRHILGYGDAKVKTEITKFCEANDRNFYPIPNIRWISKIVKSSIKEFKNTLDPIFIRKKEIDEIKKIKNFKYQKILIGFLALAKLYKRDHVWLNEWRAIRKTISRYIPNKTIINCITEAYSIGIIGEPKADFHSLLFINHESEIVISINNDKDFFNLGKRYEELNGGVLEYCKICGDEFVRKTSTHKYCEKHQIEKRRERHLKYNKKRITTSG